MEIEIFEDNLAKYWHKKGDVNYYHREDGPAVIWNYRGEAWWYYNTLYKYPVEMPLNLFLAYVKWEYKKNV